MRISEMKSRSIGKVVTYQRGVYNYLSRNLNVICTYEYLLQVNIEHSEVRRLFVPICTMYQKRFNEN